MRCVRGPNIQPWPEIQSLNPQREHWLSTPNLIWVLTLDHDSIFDSKTKNWGTKSYLNLRLNFQSQLVIQIPSRPTLKTHDLRPNFDFTLRLDPGLRLNINPRA